VKPPLLACRSLHAGYGARPIIRDVTLALAAGESLALVGPNAAGKSTLLRALAGSLPPQRGEVLLSGTTIAGLPARERALQLALVPQAAREDLDFTVREMVAIGRAPRSGPWGLETAADRAAITRALEAADLGALASRPFRALSGGERQRTLFARALAQEAHLWLLDEPTAHLDLSHQLLLLERVSAHVAGGGAVLWVLHDLTLAARLDRVAVLEQGQLVADGAPAQVLTPARLAATWGVRGALEGGPGAWTLRLDGRVS
jgi:iron complex transport system ATP-binding protein